jgi:hypothetical protein
MAGLAPQGLDHRIGLPAGGHRPQTDAMVCLTFHLRPSDEGPEAFRFQLVDEPLRADSVREACHLDDSTARRRLLGHEGRLGDLVGGEDATLGGGIGRERATFASRARSKGASRPYTSLRNATFVPSIISAIQQRMSTGTGRARSTRMSGWWRSPGRCASGPSPRFQRAAAR